MAAQGERVSGVVDMCSSDFEPMVQDTPVQDITIPEQDDSLPQMDPKLEMGAAAADLAPPPPLRQIPSPTPSETVTDNGGSVQLSPTALAQMVEKITQAMRGEMRQMGKEIIDGMSNKMDTDARNFMDRMDAHTQAFKKGCGKWANVCRRAKWRRYVLCRAS